MARQRVSMHVTPSVGWLGTGGRLVDEIRERGPLLVLVDELVRATREPVLVPDIRTFVSFVVPTPSAQELFYSPTLIFHFLRDMVADGLVSHSPRGYDLTPEGRDEAQRVRVDEPEVAARAAEAVRDYVVQH